MTNKHIEQWENYDNCRVDVEILRRYLTLEDICPECGGGLRIAVGTMEGEQVFRFECVACPWTSETLPDPDA